MPKKKPIKKDSVKANLQVVELTRTGSSLDLEIYADQERVGSGQWAVASGRQDPVATARGTDLIAFDVLFTVNTGRPEGLNKYLEQ